MALSPIALPAPQIGQPCPCGSGQPYEACCQPLLTGKSLPANAEKLMRSRFTAHVAHDYRYLHNTYQGTADLPYVEEKDDAPMKWTRLVVHTHEAGKTPGTAFVDFSAYFTEDGAEHAVHEKSEFHQVAGRWLYTRPVRQGPAPIKKSAEAKVGRNDPCPCGSGKKYKKCCGVNA